jgi:hypothetical protein
MALSDQVIRRTAGTAKTLITHRLGDATERPDLDGLRHDRP